MQDGRAPRRPRPASTRCTFASRKRWSPRHWPRIRESESLRWRSALEHRGRHVSIEVKVPQLPESVADATLVSWHKKAGDAVRRDENLVDLETDKVVLEVPAPSDGILKEIRVGDGATVTAGQVLAVLEPGAAAAARKDGAEAAEQPAPAAAEEAPAASAAEPAREAAAPAAESEAPSAAVADQPRQESRDVAQRMGPAVRKLVEEHDIDPTAIRGSG